MENLIKVKIKSVYGSERIYPCNELATVLTELKGCKTLERADLKALMAAGFKVEFIADIPAELL